MAHDALGAHARDELGITDLSIARPLQAAGASAASFACGALLPLLVAALALGADACSWAVPGDGARLLGGARRHRRACGRRRVGVAAARVTFWGALAMAATAGIGQLFGTIVQ